MFKSLLRPALLWATLPTLLLAPNAFAGSSGMSAGKVSYSDLGVMMALHKSGDDKRQDYLTITLEEVMVSGYQNSAGSGTGKTMAAEVLG